jgi:glycogen phosphorylase
MLGLRQMSQLVSVRPVAYFCAEFGLQAELPLYAGGLGVLAGDTVKEAADQNFPMVAVGILYRGKNAIQVISADGIQTEADVAVDPVAIGFEHVYVPQEDQPLFVRVHLTKLDVWARVWKRTVNKTTLYLLDTDTDQNQLSERSITKALYYGSDEELIKQQMILGIGGVKLLNALNIKPFVFHINEGRPAFLLWQIIRDLMDKYAISYQEALTKAKQMIVYTNHTLVREGNQAYDSGVLEKFSAYYAQKMGISVEELLRPGVEKTTGKFNMTLFALNSCRKASAVSQPHYDLSKNLWPEFNWVNITNGVHMPTWQDNEILGVDKTGTGLWDIHQKKKRETQEFIAQRIGFGYDPTQLVMCWSRRITGYKRLNALFEDLNRLKQILYASGQKVTLLIAGKAHASDVAAKQLIQKTIKLMQTEITGQALYIPNYDITVAQNLTRGVDLWLNTPYLGQEASGTSGMKALANGVLQLTVADGWAAEVNWTGVGWTLDPVNVASSLYTLLEKEIVPMFYNRDEGVPNEWLTRMKRSIEIADLYSTTRMLADYQEKLYEAKFL